MKITVELPDDLLCAAKAAAARQGTSLKEVLTVALRNHLRGSEKVPRGQEAWRHAFGSVDPKVVAEIDRIIEEEFETIDLETWR
jgi:plasmid stability protein